MKVNFSISFSVNVLSALNAFTNLNKIKSNVTETIGRFFLFVKFQISIVLLKLLPLKNLGKEKY